MCCSKKNIDLKSFKKQLFIQCTDILFPNFWHGFFGRNGGFSNKQYASLNCNLHSNDHPKNVQKNLNKILEIANYHSNAHSQQNFLTIKTLKQVHKNRVLLLDNIDQETSDIEADAIVTKIPNILLGVKTADCVPILLCDTKNKIIAAIHAGWRSAVSGIIQNTISLMKKISCSNRDKER